MVSVSEILKQLISSGGIEQFQTSEVIQQFETLDSFKELTIVEQNLLKRCAEYQLFPEMIYRNEPSAQRNAHRLSNDLVKRHGIEEKHASAIAAEIVKAFSQITVSTFDNADNAKAAVKQNEQTKKKGFFSFFKKG